jgi:peptidoglycan-associated lipoprotein
MKKIFPILIIAGMFISGCAHTSAVKETAQPEPQKQMPATEQKQIENKQANKQAPQENIASKEVPPPVDSLSLMRAMQAKLKDIHFDFDKYIIRNDDKPLLKQVADTLREHSDVKVIIEGNCDERGTTEYNLALGERRAVAAKEYLSSLGSESGRMDTVSNGKEKPVCTESNEACWTKNRNDHFVLEGTR